MRDGFCLNSFPHSLQIQRTLILYFAPVLCSNMDYYTLGNDWVDRSISDVSKCIRIDYKIGMVSSIIYHLKDT